jgi:hypothetical protein
MSKPSFSNYSARQKSQEISAAWTPEERLHVLAALGRQMRAQLADGSDNGITKEQLSHYANTLCLVAQADAAMLEEYRHAVLEGIDDEDWGESESA